MFGLKWDAKGRFLLVATAIGAAGAASPVRPVIFMGRSMTPTYANHEIVWATKKIGTLHRGDVVVVDTPQGTVVKRVGLLPGDGYYEENRYGYWLSTLLIAKRSVRGRQRFIMIPEGKVYLVGDNFSYSVDSRDFGPIPIENVRLKLLDQRENRGTLALYGAVLRKNFALRTQKPL